MTTIDLDEVERLYNAATPGDWHGDRQDGSIKYRLTSGDDCELVLAVDHKNFTSGFLGDRGKEDAALIIALHNAFPALLAELRENRQRIAALEAENAKLARWIVNHSDSVSGDHACAAS